MIDAIRCRLQPLYGTDQTLAASGSIPKLSAEEEVILKHLTCITFNYRADEWNDFSVRFKENSFGQQVALLLLGKQQEPINPTVRDYTLKLLDDCRLYDEETNQFREKLKSLKTS